MSTDRELLDTTQVARMIGADLAAMLDPGTLALCVEDTSHSEVRVTANELAVARALLFRVSGSALLDGDKRAIKDAATLYRMVSAANSLLIGSIDTRAAAAIAQEPPCPKT